MEGADRVPETPVLGSHRAAPAIPKLLIDTNVVLDVILERKAWVEDATALLDAIAKGRAEGHIPNHTITTVYYIVERERNRSVAATAFLALRLNGWLCFSV